MLKLVTAPTAEPVSLEEIKEHCRISASTDDALLLSLIAAARSHAEQKTGRAMVEQTLTLTLDEFPGTIGHIELPKPPLVSVTSVKYDDTDEVEQTLSADLYEVKDASDYCPAYIVPAYGETWPVTLAQPEAVRIVYKTGWPITGSPAAPVTPEDIKAWIKIRVAGLYENRESFMVGQAVAEFPYDFVDGLLDRWKVWEIV
jgi:uncharacterized phiE125 gp8 family phage protein